MHRSCRDVSTFISSVHVSTFSSEFINGLRDWSPWLDQNADDNHSVLKRRLLKQFKITADYPLRWLGRGDGARHQRDGCFKTLLIHTTSWQGFENMNLQKKVSSCDVVLEWDDVP